MLLCRLVRLLAGRRVRFDLGCRDGWCHILRGVANSHLHNVFRELYEKEVFGLGNA